MLRHWGYLMHTPHIPGHFYGGFFLLNVGEVSGIFSRCVDGFVDIRMFI